MLFGRLGGRDSGPHRAGEAGDQGEIAPLGQVTRGQTRIGSKLYLCCQLSQREGDQPRPEGRSLHRGRGGQEHF